MTIGFGSAKLDALGSAIGEEGAHFPFDA